MFLCSYSVDSKRYAGLNPHGMPAVEEVKKGIATLSSENFRTPPHTVCSHPGLDLVLKEIIKTVNIFNCSHYVCTYVYVPACIYLFSMLWEEIDSK